jgi:hypothetical protein
MATPGMPDLRTLIPTLLLSIESRTG